MHDGQFDCEIGLGCIRGSPQLETNRADDIEVFRHWGGLVHEDVLPMVVGRLVDGDGLGVLVHQRHDWVAGVVFEIVGNSTRFLVEREPAVASGGVSRAE